MAMSPAAHLAICQSGDLHSNLAHVVGGRERRGEGEREGARARTRARGGEGEREEIERSRGGASGGSPGIQPE